MKFGGRRPPECVSRRLSLHRCVMRLAFFALLGFTALLSAQQDNTPNDNEKKAITALKKYKGAKTGINPKLHAEGRLTLKLDTATDAILADIAKHPEIGSFQALDGTACTVKGFTALHNLPQLRRLTLNKSGVSDKELAVIAGCKELRELVLPESTITDAGLVEIEKLPKLEKLDISDAAKVTDKGIAHIVKLERLEELFLNKTSITDKGLLELKPLEGLRALSVGGTKVTQAAAEKFPDMMPNLRVVRR